MDENFLEIINHFAELRRLELKEVDYDLFVRKLPTLEYLALTYTESFEGTTTTFATQSKHLEVSHGITLFVGKLGFFRRRQRCQIDRFGHSLFERLRLWLWRILSAFEWALQAQSSQEIVIILFQWKSKSRDNWSYRNDQRTCQNPFGNPVRLFALKNLESALKSPTLKWFDWNERNHSNGIKILNLKIFKCDFFLNEQKYVDLNFLCTFH